MTLSHGGEDVADARLDPDGESFRLTFRVPRERLDGDEGMNPVTIADLLTAAGVSEDEVESWEFDQHSPREGEPPQPVEPQDEPLATIGVKLKSAGRTASAAPDVLPDVPPETWQALEAVWKTVLGLEAGIDSLRVGMDGLRAEMEGAFRKQMGIEEKLHAMQADVILWNKAKSRVHYAVPKVREFVHRATWAAAAAERKRLGELFKSHIEPRIPFPGIETVRERMEHLQKDRQILLAQGNAVGQEGRALLAEIQRAFGTLQRNAADRARQKRSAGREKGKHL